MGVGVRYEDKRIWPVTKPLRSMVCDVRFGSKADIGRPSNDDVSSCAGNYCLDLRLLGLRHGELVKCLLEIVEKCLPLCRRYHEMLVRFLHGAAGVLLRPSGGPADHFCHQILETCGRNAGMGLVYHCVRI